MLPILYLNWNTMYTLYNLFYTCDSMPSRTNGLISIQQYNKYSVILIGVKKENFKLVAAVISYQLNILHISCYVRQLFSSRAVSTWNFWILLACYDFIYQYLTDFRWILSVTKNVPTSFNVMCVFSVYVKCACVFISPLPIKPR